MATQNDPMVNNKCPKIMTYEEKRKANLDKIQDYYSELLQDYETAPIDDPNRNTKDKLKTQITKLVNEMIQKLKDSTDEVINQHNIFIEKKQEYDNIRTRHDTLLTDIKQLQATANARDSNVENNVKYTRKVKLYHRLYLTINIIFLLITVFLLFK